MANNVAKYGFRYYGSHLGGCCPKPMEFLVANAYQAQVSATDVDLNVGDPVMFNNSGPDTGFIELAAAGGTGRFWGVIVGFTNVKVGLPLKGRKYSRLPGGTTWTTEENASKVLVVPFAGNIWEIDVTGNTSSFDTLTEYRTLVNKNCDLSYVLDVSDPDRPKANPRLDVSTNAETTKDFRVVGVSKTAMNQDYSGNFVKLLVTVNESGQAPFSTGV